MKKAADSLDPAPLEPPLGPSLRTPLRTPLDEHPRALSRRALWFEIALVFTLTLGMSGLRSIVNLIDAALAPQTLASQTVSIVVPQARAGFLDLIKQLLSVVSGVAAGLLGLYLLWRGGVHLKDRLGLDLRWKDAGAAIGIAAIIGIPGLGLYLLSHAMGLSLTVVPATLNDTWWRIPVLLLQALQNGVIEEFLVVGYLVTRLQQLRIPVWGIVAITSLLRGSYHLYQGWGGGVGNIAMGVVFTLAFLYWRRLWPLVIAHSLIDAVVFVGYPLVKGSVSWIP